MSEFEKLFGKQGEDWETKSDLIAKIRDDFFEQLEQFAPDSSLVSSEECTLYAIYKILKEYKNG